MSKITNMRKVKQDDKFSLAMRDIQSQHPANKKCFDCEQRGPTYINMTIGSFVCTKCSGMLRGINPPHRIKSISMSSFSSDEVDMLRSRGNAWCAAVWLGNYNRSSNPVDLKDDEKVKEFIVAKYEKKRYYIDPAQANLSSIKQQLTGGSTGSVDSQGSHKLHSSSLIGSTLKARVDPSSVMGHSNTANSFIVSRPEHVSQPHVPTHVVQVTVARPEPNPAPSNGQLSSAAPAAPTGGRDNFADFANFDAAAFDSEPADPLTAPPPALPPLKKSSTVAPPVQSTGDKYSALAELDDLFRSTGLDTPTPGGGAVPGPAVPSLLMSEAVNEGCQAWGGRDSPGGVAGGKTSPMWTPQWGTSAVSATQESGWPDTANILTFSQNTNPFGTSPSNPPMGKMYSDNNNDLFAAAPKPFISDKPGLTNSGNPWSGVLANVPGASPFTSSMTPAHNPNNPFL